ncbi:YebY family protein [Trichocoleus sp. Lan]|uniref:DUF2511 domain-containing protein n=1 Tax=Trichocoleus sp. Lan TaxID=2933927 RepID=UPI00329771A8
MKLIPPCLTLLILILAGCSVEGYPAKVTQSEYGEQWPFTVAEGTIDCNPSVDNSGNPSVDKSDRDVVLRVGEDVYAVNSKARSTAQRTGLYKDLAEIWRDQPANNGGKVAIPDKLIQQGLKICDNQEVVTTQRYFQQ